MTVEEYQALFRAQKGSDLDRVRAILAQCSHQWGWEGHDSVVTDLLDDRTVTIEGILTILEAGQEYECRSESMKNAIAAIKKALHKV